MPTINQLQKKPKKERNNTDQRKLRQKAYNDVRWRKGLRISYLQEHPCCEDCLRENRVTAAEDVHHKVSPFRKGEIDYELLLDRENLIALCKKCHSERHMEENNQISATKMVELLDALFEDVEDEN